MANSPLDFIGSDAFRKKLITKNLRPYRKFQNRPPSQMNYETVQSDYAVIDSPDALIDDPTLANRLYPLNRYGASGGYKQVPDPTALLNKKSNEGEYGPGQQDARILDQALPESKNWKKVNLYGDATNAVLDSGEFIVTLDTPKFGVGVYNNQPYFTFVPSSYAPVNILLNKDPQGNNGLLSQDSYIAKLGATILRKEFETRIATQIRRQTLGRINVFNVRSGTDVLDLVTGRVPILQPNYQITVPANPILAATDFALRLAGSIIPASTIPGSYFDPSINSGLPTTIQQLSNAYRRQTATGLASTFTRLLGAPKSGSQLFLNNTGGGQKSRLFGNLNYNKYKPDYDRSIFDRVGGQLVGTITNNSNFYVGSVTSDPSRIFSPGGDIPINDVGQEIQSPVYGPSALAELYEGNTKEVKIGSNGPIYSDGGGIEGGFTWVSPKYKGNAGKKVGIGGEVTQQDQDFKPSSYNNTESTNYQLKQGSILDETQRLINSQPQGGRRLKHVGNAIDQVSKVFNDGYNEMTKGSRVIRYVGSIGQEVGTEYCRVFAKDVPYLQYNDLQKTDGTTTEGRKFSYSVLDKTYNLNIAPNKREGGQDSTNLIMDTANGTSYAKKYMFSLENLAWRTSNTPGLNVSELAVCERGPNGGRIMWFPPYGLTFNESVSANWKENDFLGRPEPIYTYTNTRRTGTLQWKIVVDHPSVLNMIVNKVLNNETNKTRVNSILQSFFAGCRKYDLYELAKKYYTVTPGELNELQQLINGKELSNEQLGFIRDSVATGNNTTGNQSQVVTDPNQNVPTDNLKQFELFALYFPNAFPTEGSVSEYSTYYSQYQTDINNNKNYTSQQDLQLFNTSVIVKNYDEVSINFINQLSKILENPNNKVTITLEGSASAAGSPTYNQKLSERRIDSVIKFFAKNSIINKAIENKRVVFVQKAVGEKAVVRRWKKESGFVEEAVNCSNAVDNPTDSNNAAIYSIDAMGCRRVTISTVVISPSVPTQQPTSATQPAGGSGTQPIVPIPKQELETKSVKRDNISKRVLRALLSECDYFETIKEETPMVFDSLKEKLKFFQPGFHSTTPEGLNSRLTFLQQCLRPGDTIPTVKQSEGGKAELQFNNATNTSFGVPPVLILRIGDFYNTKIIPDSLSLTYEALDINPEGIGIQPMIANVSMNFKFVGGSGLKESIDKLQNALSFNYYANTEMWDDRADATDDSLKAYDKQFLQLVNQAGAPTTNQIQNLNGQSNENTIGNRLRTVSSVSGETGTMSYQEFMDNFVSQTQTYFQTVLNKTKDVLKQYNNAVRQNWTIARLYTKGNFLVNTNDEVPLFGKPDSIQKIISDVTKDLVDDIESNNTAKQDRFINYISQDQWQFSTKTIREIRKNYKKYVQDKSKTFENALTTITAQIVNIEQVYLQSLSRINTVPYSAPSRPNTGTDGFQEKQGKVRNFIISGTTLVQQGSSASDTLVEMVDDIKKVQNDLMKYYEAITTENSFVYLGNPYKGTMVYQDINSKEILNQVFLPFSKSESFKNFESFKRMYMILSNDLKPENYETFKNAIIGNIINNDAILGNGFRDISQKFDAYWKETAKPIFDQEDAITQAFLDEMEKNKLKNFLNYTPFPSKTRLFDYFLNQNPTDNEQKLIKFLGASSNNSTNKKTWNDIVTAAGPGSIYQSKVKLN